MTNYQILEIIFDAAFFATVAAIAVIFVLIRERVLTKDLAGRQAGTTPTFPGLLDHASGSINELPGVFGESRNPHMVGDWHSTPKPELAAKQDIEKKELSRAEKELMANIAAGKP